MVLQGDLVNKHGQAKVNILVDVDVPEQCVNLLRSLIDIKAEIVFVDSFSGARCDHLYYCHPFFHALDNTKHPEFNSEDFHVAHYPVKILVESIRARHKFEFEPEKLLYIPRLSSQFRQIKNESQVRELLVSRGFEIYQPGGETIESQIESFFRARCIVGASGAAFTNTIFMQPSTCAVLFAPDVPFNNYHLFQRMADVSGVDLVQLETSNPNQVKTLHDDVYLDVNLLEKALDDLLA